MRRFRPVLAITLLSAASLAAPGRPDAPAEPVLRQYLDHAGFTWKTKQTDHFRLYFEPGSEADRYLGQLRKNVEKDRAAVLRLIGVPDYEPVVHAFLLDSGAHMKDLVGADVNGRSRPVQHVVFSVISADRLHLTHELCHEIVSNLWGAAEPWIEEGLATYADEGANVYYDSWTLLKSGNLLPLDRLVNPEWKSNMDSPDVTYAELGAFVKFLTERYGVERIKRVWQGGSVSIPEVFGKPLSELEEEWRESLVRQFPKPPTRHYRSGVSGDGIR